MQHQETGTHYTATIFAASVGMVLPMWKPSANTQDFPWVSSSGRIGSGDDDSLNGAIIPMIVHGFVDDTVVILGKLLHLEHAGVVVVVVVEINSCNAIERHVFEW